MGNIRGWGGPLSRRWHQKSVILQKKILTRMREFGITPVLPGFNGQVPQAFKRLCIIIFLSCIHNIYVLYGHIINIVCVCGGGCICVCMCVCSALKNFW